MSTEEINKYVDEHIEEFTEFDDNIAKEWAELDDKYNEWMGKYRGLLFRTNLPINLAESQIFFGQAIRDLFVSTHLKTNPKGQE